MNDLRGQKSSIGLSRIHLSRIFYPKNVKYVITREPLLRLAYKKSWDQKVFDILDSKKNFFLAAILFFFQKKNIFFQNRQIRHNSRIFTSIDQKWKKNFFWFKKASNTS